MDDVGVLSGILPPLLAVAAASSLQHFMDSVLSNGAAGSHAGLVSDILQPRSTGGQVLRLRLQRVCADVISDIVP
jgi:hypothetical protein